MSEGVKNEGASSTALARFDSLSLCSKARDSIEKMQSKKGAVQATISLKGEQLHRVDVPGSGTRFLSWEGSERGNATERKGATANHCTSIYGGSFFFFFFFFSTSTSTSNNNNKNSRLNNKKITDSTLPSEALAALKTSIGAFLTEYMKQNAIAVEGQDGPFFVFI